MNVSNISSWVIYAVLLLICLFFVYFLGFFRGGRSAQRRYIPPSPPPPPRKSLSGCFIKLLLIFALTASMLALLFYSALLRSYHAFTGKQLVAVVYCQPIHENDFDFALELIPIIGETPQDTSKYLLRGDQWAVEGNILKWKDYMNFLGLKTMYRLTRVRGRYLSAKKEASEPSSVYALADEERSQKWKWLYKYGDRLPFVTSAYGNTVYTYPISKREFKIFVTTSGFMVEGQGGESKSRNNILELLRMTQP
jgi:hypothetical protein